ncbi:MAG: hypothetical protein LBV06_01705 [Propionibacteriaceae bacterium]|jgi:hypothetical protein|nr:hypothetical protein [Propionibacteriaceae bacterium]
MARSIPEATVAVGRVRAMPFGRSRTEAAARQVRITEAEGPDEVRAYALESLVEALTWTSDYAKAAAPFIKLLRWWDTHPEMFDVGDQNILFWEFGWIVSDLARNPAIPMSVVDRTLDDMERRFQLANRGMERVWAARLEWEMLRQGPQLEQTFTTWLTLPVDAEDSCAACHEAHHAEYLISIGELTGAQAVIEAALAADLGCSREPASMLSWLTWCFVEQGQLDEADRVLPQTLTQMRSATSLSILGAYSRLFEVFARGGNLARAAQMMAKMSEGLKIASPYAQLETWRHVVAGCHALSTRGWGDQRLIMPQMDATTVDGLARQAAGKAAALTTAFDQRHGNDAQAKRLADAWATAATTRALRALVAVADDAETTKDDTPEADQSQAASDSGEPTAAPKTEPAVTTTWQRAEKAFSDGQSELAAQLYRQAGDEAQAVGHLAQSGWCWAEAARNLQEAGQWTQATYDYAQAHARLSAAGTSLEDIAPVFIAWAAMVSPSDYRTYVDLALRDYPSAAGPEATDKIEELVSSTLMARLLGSPLVKRYVVARAGVRDAVARVLATWGDTEDKESAMAMAQESASRFSLLGRTDDAAHAWWLAGKIAADLGRHTAGADYAMALQSFRSTGERNRSYARATARDFAAYLRAEGQDDKADELQLEWNEPEV